MASLGVPFIETIQLVIEVGEGVPVANAGEVRNPKESAEALRAAVIRNRFFIIFSSTVALSFSGRGHNRSRLLLE